MDLFDSTNQINQCKGRGGGGGKAGGEKLSWQQVPARNIDICQCELHLQDS